MATQADHWTVEEGFCPERGDETHCNCWQEGLLCCACNHDSMGVNDDTTE